MLSSSGLHLLPRNAFSVYLIITHELPSVGQHMFPGALVEAMLASRRGDGRLGSGIPERRKLYTQDLGNAEGISIPSGVWAGRYRNSFQRKRFIRTEQTEDANEIEGATLRVRNCSLLKQDVRRYRRWKARRHQLLFYLLFLLCVTHSCFAVPMEEGVFLPFAYVGRDSSSNDEPAHIVTTINGTLFVAGTSCPLERGTKSDLGLPLNSDLSDDDIFIAKVTAETGDVEWVYRGGTSKEDRLQAIVLEKSGRYLYAGGRTFGQFPGAGKYGQSDIFVVKYDVSGDKPVEVWPNPLVLGTPASESISSMKIDPRNETVVYATGFTSGALFPGREANPDGTSDAILFSFSTENGSILSKRQFGTNFADQGAGIVVSDIEEGPLFVSVVTERKIGQYTFGNFHMYKFRRDGTPLGDLLLRTYSREQVSSFGEHPLLPGTLLSLGSSWLDTREGYDVFVKRIVRPFDNSNIGTTEVDIGDVGVGEYTKRIPSSDGSHDYASGMIVDAESGRVIISGYTAGTFAPNSLKRGILSPFIGVVDPLEGSLTGAKQMELETNRSWVEIASIAMANGKRGVYYAAKESNEESNQFHIAIGTFGFPLPWKTMISIAASPDPSPSPKTGSGGTNQLAKKKSPVAIIAGSACGALVLAVASAAIVMGVRTRQRSKALKAYNADKVTPPPTMKPGNIAPRPADAPLVEGSNVSGLA